MPGLVALVGRHLLGRGRPPRPECRRRSARRSASCWLSDEEEACQCRAKAALGGGLFGSEVGGVTALSLWPCVEQLSDLLVMKVTRGSLGHAAASALPCRCCLGETPEAAGGWSLPRVFRGRAALDQLLAVGIRSSLGGRDSNSFGPASKTCFAPWLWKKVHPELPAELLALVVTLWGLDPKRCR